MKLEKRKAGESKTKEKNIWERPGVARRWYGKITGYSRKDTEGRKGLFSFGLSRSPDRGQHLIQNSPLFHVVPSTSKTVLRHF